jgi:hypothetical protein
LLYHDQRKQFKNNTTGRTITISKLILFRLMACLASIRQDKYSGVPLAP